MKITATLSFLAALLVPSFVLADCRGDKMQETAATCIAGTAWDDAKGACVANPTS